MTNDAASAILQFLCDQLDFETATTRKVLAAVPDEKLDYTPHPTSMTALNLAVHLATADAWFIDSILKGAPQAMDKDAAAALTKGSQVLAFYDDAIPVLSKQLRALSGEEAGAIINLFGMDLPRVNYLSIMVTHSVHHRGQLSTYLRPLGAKVPDIYGGSADSKTAAAEA